MRRVSLALLALAVAACNRSPTDKGATRALAIASVREIGVIGKPASVIGRDGGPSNLIGGKILWTFGDTFFPAQATDGSNYRTNTAALADPARPLETTEPLDAKGAPYHFVRFTAEDKAYNDSTGKPDDRIAVWPGSVIPDGNGGGIVFYVTLRVKPGFLNYEFIGTGIARVAPGSTTAVRDPTLLFTAPEPSFDKAYLLGSDVYVYGGLPGGPSDLPVVVARVPLAQAGNRAAYRFWNGSRWTADVGQAEPVLRDIPGGVSVSFNAYLGTYLAVHSGVFSNTIFIRTAPRPEGPWSNPVAAVTGMTPSSGTDYAGLEHPELASNGGQTVVISYARTTGFLRGEMRLVEVGFK